MSVNGQEGRSKLDAFNSPVGPALGLTPTSPDRLEGSREGNPVLIRGHAPLWLTERRSTFKTEIGTSFRQPVPLEFLVHGRGRLLLGSHFKTGDPAWDADYVIRSKTGPQACSLFGPEVRASIRMYDTGVPSLQITEKGVELLIEGDVPSAEYLDWVLISQSRILNLIVYSAKRAGLMV